MAQDLESAAKHAESSLKKLYIDPHTITTIINQIKTLSAQKNPVDIFNGAIRILLIGIRAGQNK